MDQEELHLDSLRTEARDGEAITRQVRGRARLLLTAAFAVWVAYF